jgi:glutathione S-transferase
MRKLYGHPLSGNTHKVRLMLSFLELAHEEVFVDLLAGEHKSAEYLSKNPLGQVPVLVDGDVVLRDSQAILVYLARKYGGEAWLPTEPAQMGAVVQWLSFAANEIHNGPFFARLHFLLGVDLDVARAQAGARAALKLLDEHLKGREWLELGRPTIADLACFPYIGLVPEGKVSLDDHPQVLAWIARIKALPGYPAMKGLEAAS